MGGYPDWAYIVDVVVLGGALLVGTVGSILMYIMVIMPWQRDNYMGILQRLIFGLDANPTIAMVDLFDAGEDNNRKLMLEVLQEADKGNVTRLSAFIMDRYNVDGSINPSYKKGIERSHELRREAMLDFIKQGIEARRLREDKVFSDIEKNGVRQRSVQ